MVERDHKKNVFKQDETRRFLLGGKCSRGRDRRPVEIDYKIKKICSIIVYKIS